MNEHETPEPLRVITNASWLVGRHLAGRPLDVRRLRRTGPFGTIRAFFAADRFDVALFTAEARQLVVFCLLKLLWPGRCRRLVSVDPVLQRPRNFRERLRLGIVRLLLRQVDLFLVFFRDTRGLEMVYRIDPAKIRYVPFKINDYHTVITHPTRDEGFVLSCGRSKRDYTTFCKALATLPYAARILAPGKEENLKHGTTSDFRSLPANVRQVTDDGSHASWIDWISRCTCLVLPVLPDTLAPSGISTYLVAMALGKCVIVTDGPATRGLIDDGQAVIVPASDPQALRAALVQVFENETYRHEVASRGKAYALALRDEDRLAEDVIVELGRLLGIEETESCRPPEPVAAN
jgi:glycosyltransferase involved in cell wall biosynthesis